MEVVYTGEELPYKIKKTLFLAGPSPRPNQEIESWRKLALKILEDIGFDGIVLCPEYRNFEFENDNFNYDNQIEWEDKHLNIADCILFWVPRDLSIDKNGNMKLPGFTTNVEFGAWCESGKVVYGNPEDAEKVNYLKYYIDKYNIPEGNSLTETIKLALAFLGEGSERVNGERFVPLFIWKTDSFQNWYHAQLDAGNRLENARTLYSFRPKYESFIFLWILKVNIFIASENRFKEIEFVLSRPDISTVMLWHPNEENILNSKIILIKEFRSPGATKDGFIRELPSGSSSNENAKETAAEEVQEETGFNLSSDRLKEINSRQLAGTLSSHKSHLYSVKIDNEELRWFESQKNIAHGKIEDSERTYIEIYSANELLSNEVEVDWSTLGQIFSVLFKE